MEILTKTATKIPVRLLDSVGDPLSNVEFSDVTVFLYFHSSRTSLEKTLGETDWFEASPSNFPGLYTLSLTNSDVGSPGFVSFSIKSSLSKITILTLEAVSKGESGAFLEEIAQQGEMKEELPQTTYSKHLVRIFDLEGFPKTGLTYDFLKVSGIRGNGMTFERDLVSGELREISAELHPGWYLLLITPADSTILGDTLLRIMRKTEDVLIYPVDLFFQVVSTWAP